MKIKFLVATIAVALVALIVGSSDAAGARPVERLPVCHYDADADTYELLRLPAPAITAHARHGDSFPGEEVPGTDGAFVFDDDCVLVAVEVIFAIAYGEVDGVPGYDPATDVLIAKLVDNGDGVPGAGDMVITDRYPRDPVPSTYVEFVTKQHIVSAAYVYDTSIQVVYASNLGQSQWFIAEPYLEDGWTESGPAGYIQLTDHDRWQYDRVLVWGTSPSGTTTPGRYDDPSSGDDVFVEVEIYLTQ
ncbi:MAG: hypothetical protein GY708_12660 [Actinomycetia bacterium]|nr:hypothetical protein [Actinomycetes bacterium]MCP4957739.1 hypothetical protein [Actinomycetes bacterium]